MRCHWHPYDLDYIDCIYNVHNTTQTFLGSNTYYCICSCSCYLFDDATSVFSIIVNEPSYYVVYFSCLCVFQMCDSLLYIISQYDIHVQLSRVIVEFNVDIVVCTVHFNVCIILCVIVSLWHSSEMFNILLKKTYLFNFYSGSQSVCRASGSSPRSNGTTK